MKEDATDKIKISFECKVSGTTKNVDLIIDQDTPMLVSEIEDIVKQIKKSLHTKSPNQEEVLIETVENRLSFYEDVYHMSEEDDTII